MLGFKKKPVDEVPGEPLTAKVQVMPTDFYAGANPVVTFKNVPKEVALSSGSLVNSQEKKILDKQTAPGSGDPLHPASLLANPRFLIIGGLGLVLVVGAVLGVYYWLANRSTQLAHVPPVVVTEQPQNQVVETPTTTVDGVTSSSTAVVPPTLPVSLADQPLSFPSQLLGDSVDTDKDGLTDREEELFTTDLNVPDTDGDSYSDSHELFYLYNPAGKEPMKLIDSGLVKTYTNPSFGYSLYYPTSWAMGDVDGTYRDVLFSTITGENIEVRVFDKAATTDFMTWFASAAPDQKYGDLVSFEGYFNKLTGFKRKDSLVYYFPTANHVYVLVYHTTDSTVVNFRTVLSVMARSFVTGEAALTQGAATPVFTTPATSSIPPVTTSTVTSSTSSTP
jgi:hypothetical protein